MKYLHRFRIKAPLSSVADFHLQPSGLGAITPPVIRMQLHRAPATLLSGGDELEFTLWLGLLPIHWVARIEDVTASGFTDRQLSGPFSKWVHRHTFIQVDDETTEVLDQVTVRLKIHLYWGLVGLVFWAGLPALFAYRAWKTRRLLEKGSD